MLGGNDILIGGFTDGAGESGANETVLVRAIGPGLAPFLPNDYLAGAVLTLYDARGNIVATNSGWQNEVSCGASQVSAGTIQASTQIMRSVGAFQIQ